MKILVKLIWEELCTAIPLARLFKPVFRSVFRDNDHDGNGWAAWSWQESVLRPPMSAARPLAYSRP
jgi:hypothetical protein